MKENIINRINEALASDNTSKENKKLLRDIKIKLKKAKTENTVVKIVAIAIKVITGLFEDD